LNIYQNKDFVLQLQQREAIAYTISQQDCAYLNALLALFPSAEAKNNYHALATLASIVKSVSSTTNRFICSKLAKRALASSIFF
jgi:hypothetical protein